MTLIKIPENANGSFKSGEINVIFTYSTEPDPLAEALVYIYVVAGAILALCVASGAYSYVKSKRKRMANMDIVE